jgi:hypothetical protein
MKTIQFLDGDFTLDGNRLEYTGEAEITMTLHLYNHDNTIKLSRWLSFEESGYIVEVLVNILTELLNQNFIDKTTYITLIACDISDENEGRIDNPGLDNLVRYYDRLGFVYDSQRNSTDPDTLSMKCNIHNFLQINQINQ